MLFSIITINLNNSEGLKKTIESVISQDHKDLEYIVIDGNSSDDSVSVIESYKNNIDYTISEPDSGIYDAQNKGILEATGKYLLFLNSGDVLSEKNTLSSVAALVTDASFYYGNLIMHKEGKKETHIAPTKIDLDFMLNSTFWHPCVFIKADLFKKYGLYRTDFKIAGDYEFFIRCLLKPNVSCDHINRFISVFDGSGVSNDPKLAALLTEERERAWHLNISEPIFESLKKHNVFSRSKYSKIISTIQKFRGK